MFTHLKNTYSKNEEMMQAIVSMIRENETFVICGHVNPDGDCLGSQLALLHTLQALEKKATCVLAMDEKVHDKFSFLPQSDQMICSDKYRGRADVFIAVDVPIESRIGKAQKILKKAHASLSIDHHLPDATFCDYTYVDPNAPSASMLIWDLIKRLVDKPSYEAALCCFTGLMTDTGSFCFQNTNQESFKVASEMLSYGVKPSLVSEHVFYTRSFASLKLEQIVLERIRLFADGRGAISWISQQDFEACNANKVDAEPLIGILRTIDSAHIVCILREQDGKVRGSLRSKGEYDVSIIAKKHNGGGHKGAAGLSLKMSIEKAVEVIKQDICTMFESKEA